MAKQIGTYFIGRRGPVIGYMWKQIPCLRSVPVNVKQSKATKQSAKKFGRSKTIAKHIRHAVPSLLPDTKDRKMMQRLENAVYRWLLFPLTRSSNGYRAIHQLNDISFHEEQELTARLGFQFSIDWLQPGGITINIPALLPAQQVKAPAHTVFVDMQFGALCCDLESYITGSRLSGPVRIDYNSDPLPAQQVVLPLDLTANSLALIGVRIKFIVQGADGTREVDDKAWMPAGVIDAIYTGNMEKQV